MHPGSCRVRVLLALVYKVSDYPHPGFLRHSLSVDSKHVTDCIFHSRYTPSTIHSLVSSFILLVIACSRVAGADGYAIVAMLVIQLL